MITIIYGKFEFFDIPDIVPEVCTYLIILELRKFLNVILFCILLHLDLPMLYLSQGNKQ
jgi:hypothetical protein